jgi:hypothetical protein
MAHRTHRTLSEPDFIILASNGRTFFIEAKSKIGKLTPGQLGVKLLAEKLGHAIHTVRSFDQFIAIIDAAS